ncbi:MAG: peptidoglycan bridge formation glycyltransferase FemA/FemB family protein, partial [Bdellovibrionia bacterium]
HSLSLRPRWTDSTVRNRLSILPIEAAEQCFADTLILKLRSSKAEQFEALSHRMQRTLSRSWESPIQTKWEKLSSSLLRQFVPGITAFSSTRGFAIPPLTWFQALTQEPKIQSPWTPSFWLVTSEKQEKSVTQALTQILICQMGKEAHYLFGYENRLPGLRSAISTSATAHWEAITQCARMGIETYDFNGYMKESQPEDPYFGVCEFKKQFAGEIVRYVVPEFRIQ